MGSKEKGYQLGILGGMGPLATATLYTNIVKKTSAKCDQEHIEMVILNKCSIPDRTRAILYNEESPLDKLNEGIEELITLGCKYFIMPCNTAHSFKSGFKNLDKITFIDMIDEAVSKLSKKEKDYIVLCTNGTREVNVYNAPFLKYPNADIQNKVMDIITKTKAGLDQYDALVSVIKDVSGNVLLACTELSIYFDRLKEEHFKYDVDDAMDILINKTIMLCKGK